jgi:hypothetical protein
MAEKNQQAVMQILPGLQYLARAAHDSGAVPVSGWIGETIARIVDWADGEKPEAQSSAQTPQNVDTALAEVLTLARRAGLEETAQRLEDSMVALERDRRRLRR